MDKRLLQRATIAICTSILYSREIGNMGDCIDFARDIWDDAASDDRSAPVNEMGRAACNCGPRMHERDFCPTCPRHALDASSVPWEPSPRVPTSPGHSDEGPFVPVLSTTEGGGGAAVAHFPDTFVSVNERDYHDCRVPRAVWDSYMEAFDAYKAAWMTVNMYFRRSKGL